MHTRAKQLIRAHVLQILEQLLKMLPIIMKLKGSIIFLLLMLAAVAMGQLECRYAIGRYRNCTCGVQYRIVEKRCCSSDECLQPELSTENFTCPFVCQNGGNFDSNKKMCVCPSGHHGLCCEKETALCGEILVQHTGEIASLDYPDDYPNNANCIWKISTDPNRRIVLGTHAKSFDLEPGNNIYSCTYDYLKVFDGTSDRGQCLGTFCGSKYFRRYFQTVHSIGSNLFVQFSSDFIVARKGFLLSYSVFFAGQECGPFSTFTHTRGTITSPHHPIPYRPNESCQWTIRIKEGHDLILTFQNIDIPATMNCRYGDYLIVSGRKVDSRKLKHLVAFCGTKTPRPLRISTHTREFNEVVLTFKSNRSIEGSGFVLDYRQIPADVEQGSSE